MTDTTQALMVVDAESHNHLRESERKALIKTTAMAPHATDDEFRLFLAVADRLGLDPLTRQIYAIHRRNGKDERGGDRYQMTIQTGIDGFAAIAERTKVYAGADDIAFDVEDAEHPNKATATVYRFVQGMRVSFSASARWLEYRQTYRDNKGAAQTAGKWSDMPYNMLGKCALAKALRMAFPVQLSGIYTDDEMGQADNQPAHIAETATRATPMTAPARPVDGARGPLDTITPAEWGALKKRMFTECKLTTAELFTTFIQAHIGRDLGGALPTLAEYDKLIAAVNRAAAALRKTERTTRPAAPPTPSLDELAAAQADYEAAQMADAAADA